MIALGGGHNYGVGRKLLGFFDYLREGFGVGIDF
jgi:hypothetical protein